MSWRTLLCLALVVLSASSGSQAHEVEGSALWERINKPEQTIPIYALNETELIRALSADVNRGTGGPEQSE